MGWDKSGFWEPLASQDAPLRVCWDGAALRNKEMVQLLLITGEVKNKNQ